jgi:hypothetical protein
MTIRKCPACAQLIHFQAESEIETCWNCGRTAVRAQLKLLEQRVVDSAVRAFDNNGELRLGPPSYNKQRRIALLIALPVVVLMLMNCNSLDIHIIYSLIVTHGSDRIPTFDFGNFDCILGLNV